MCDMKLAEKNIDVCVWRELECFTYGTSGVLIPGQPNLIQWCPPAYPRFKLISSDCVILALKCCYTETIFCSLHTSEYYDKFINT